MAATDDEHDDAHGAWPDDGDDGGERALLALQRARRRNRLATLDRFEALYNVYLAGLLGSLAVVMLSNLAGDRQVTPAQLHDVTRHGAAVAGLVLSLAVVVGIRSGGRGGPLALPAADVRHVLLAPVDRSAALRGPALRQLRFGASAGAAVGAVAGVNLSHRLPHPSLAWVATGALVGALTALTSLGAALVVGGLRLGRAWSGVLALLVLAWSGLDVWKHLTTSPLTALGGLALLPLGTKAFDVVALALALLAPLGLAVVGGGSLEAAEDRARLVGQLRFAATLGDVRTVLVLRRQLAQERPRSRPWIRLRTGLRAHDVGAGGRRPVPEVGATGATGHEQAPVPSQRPPWALAAERSVRNLLRWPAGRLLRLVVLAAGAGLLCRIAWSGTRVLIVPAGLCAYLAGLDAVEPLAQQLDHPDRTDGLPVPDGAVRVALMVVPMVALSLIGLIGIGAAIAAGAPVATAFQVGLPAAVATGVLACCGAAVSTIKGPDSAGDAALLTPEIAGTKAMFRLGFPPACGILGLLPVLFAQAQLKKGLAPGQSAFQVAVPLVGVVGFLTLAWVRFREDLQAFLAEAGAAGKAGGKPAPREGAEGDE